MFLLVVDVQKCSELAWILVMLVMWVIYQEEVPPTRFPLCLPLRLCPSPCPFIMSFHRFLTEGLRGSITFLEEKHAANSLLLSVLGKNRHPWKSIKDH